MRKMQMRKANKITFEEGCNMYLENCRQRNLREGTINHYKQSYRQIYKYFEPDTPIEAITESTYNDYVIYLRENLNKDVSINAYLRDLITTLHFLMNEGYITPFISIWKAGEITATKAKELMNLKRTTFYKLVN